MHIERGQLIVATIQIDQASVASQGDRRQLAVTSTCQRSHCSTVIDFKSSQQRVIINPGLGQRLVAVRIDGFQLGFVRDSQRRQLVVAAVEFLKVPHRVDGTQISDLAVITIQIGDSGTVGQARDGLQVGVLVAFQLLYRGTSYFA